MTLSAAFFPVRTHPEFLRDVELNRWEVPDNLKNRVLDSLEELQALFPPTDKRGKVYLRTYNAFGEGFKRYSRDLIRDRRPLVKSAFIHVDVAYGCPHCEKIIVGPPVLGDQLTGELEINPSTNNLFYSCQNCIRTFGLGFDLPV